MKNVRRIPEVMFGLMLACLGPLPVRAVEDRTVEVSAENRAMNQAIGAARAKLPHFWRVMAAPRNGENDFCLKVRITDGDDVEHFWCTDLTLKKGVISGIIGNDPELVKTVKIGQRITIKEADISDWLYMKADKMIGNYTIRPLMKSMTPEEQAGFKAMLGDLPKD